MKKEETNTLTLRIPISMKVQIEIAAHKDGRTINSWVNKVLQEKLNESVKKQEAQSSASFNIKQYLE